MKKSSLFRTRVLAGILLLQMVALCFHAHGAAGDVDLSFDAGSGLNGPVYAIAVQPDGKMMVGGNFTLVRGLVCHSIARLNADGSGDSSFADAGANTGIGNVRAIALQSDGKVLVVSDNGLNRFNSNGGLDPGFIPPTLLDYDLFSAWLGAIAVQPDGKILIGGGFKIVNARLRGGMARLNANGSLDESFNPATAERFYSGVFCMALQPDGKVLIGGQDMTVNRGSIARLNADGSLDGSFHQATRWDSVSLQPTVYSLALQPDGKVLIGGDFTVVNGTDSREGLARLNANGILDASFDPGTGANTKPWFLSFALQPDGKVLIGGDFTAYNGTDRNGIARLNADGSLDGSFIPLAAYNNWVYVSMTLQADGKLLIGPGLARLNADGSLDGTFNTGRIAGTIDSLFLDSNGLAIINGGPGRLHADGSLDYSFINPSGGFGPFVLQPDGKLLLGGIVRLNADWSVDTSFNTGTGANYYPIYSVALQPDGKVLIGGQFSTFNGTNRSGIARLNSDGSLDSTFIADISPFSAFIRSLAVQPDGKILMGGEFSSVDGLHRYGIVRLNADGSLDSRFNHIAATNGSVVDVRNIVLQPDGKVLFTGNFFYVHGERRDYIARLNADGSLDTTFDAGSYSDNPSSRYVRGAGAIILRPDGRMFIIGHYYLGDDSYIQGIYRLNADGSVDSTFNPGGGLPLGVRSLALQPDGKVLIGGDFLTVNGVLRPYVARLYGDFQPPVSFAAWASSFGLSGTAAAADADPDKDDVANAAEYVLGGNPTLPDAFLHPAVTLSGGNMVFTFPRADASETPGVTLTVESGTDLVLWPAVFSIGPNPAASSPGVTIAENSTAPDTISVTIPQGADKAKFARLKVTIAP